VEAAVGEGVEEAAAAPGVGAAVGREWRSPGRVVVAGERVEVAGRWIWGEGGGVRRRI
jgi:hypothetical protein